MRADPLVRLSARSISGLSAVEHGRLSAIATDRLVDSSLVRYHAWPLSAMLAIEQSRYSASAIGGRS